MEPTPVLGLLWKGSTAVSRDKQWTRKERITDHRFHVSGGQLKKESSRKFFVSSGAPTGPFMITESGMDLKERKVAEEAGKRARRAE